MRLGKAIAAAIATHAAISDAHHTPVRPTSGTYTGNDGVNRAIPHGLGLVPKIVFIVWREVSDAIGDSTFQIMTGVDRTYLTQGGLASSLAVTAPDATNFHVGNATNTEKSANKNLYVYYWVAIG